MTKNEFLEKLLVGNEIECNGFISKWTKNEYFALVKETGEKTFSRIPNYFSFVELCQFLGVE